MAYNPLGAEGVRKLVPFLHINTTLDTLVLRGCGVQPPRVKSGVYSLARCGGNRDAADLEERLVYASHAMTPSIGEGGRFCLR